MLAAALLAVVPSLALADSGMSYPSMLVSRTNVASAQNDAATASATFGILSCTFKVSSTYSGTVAFESASDQAGVDFSSVSATPKNGGAAASTTTTTGEWQTTFGGPVTACRARMSSYTSGSATLTVIGAAHAGGGTVAVTGVPTPIPYTTASPEPAAPQCIYHASLPSLLDGQQSQKICDQNGRDLISPLNFVVTSPVPMTAATTIPVSLATTAPVSLATLPPLSGGSATIGAVNQAGAPWSFVGAGTAGSPSGGILSTQLVPVTSTGNSISTTATSCPTNCVSVAVSGYGVIGFQIVGLTASGATVTFERSSDGGTTWTNAGSNNVSGGQVATTATTDSVYAISNLGSATNVRVHVTSTGTGNITVSYVLNQLLGLPVNGNGALQVNLASATSTLGATESGTWTVQPGNTANTTPWLTQHGGGTLTKIASGSNLSSCTSEIASATNVHKIWSSAGSETATVTVYSDNSCANQLWSGVPSTTPVSFDAPVSGIYVKTSGATANHTFITTSN